MGKSGAKNGSASSTYSVEDEEKKQPILRATLCLKNEDRVREIEELEDCFILDFDPYSTESLNSSPLSIGKHSDDDLPALSVIAERGQCYCYVCDVPPPCTEWSVHCHATDSYDSSWRYLRRKRRGQELDSDSDSAYQYEENSDRHNSEELSEESD